MVPASLCCDFGLEIQDHVSSRNSRVLGIEFAVWYSGPCGSTGSRVRMFGVEGSGSKPVVISLAKAVDRMLPPVGACSPPLAILGIFRMTHPAFVPTKILRD